MVRPRWNKVVRDLFAHKMRTVLVVLSIAVGIFAVAVMMGGRGVLIRALDTTFPATRPADVSYFTSPFDDAFISELEARPDVSAAQGRASHNMSYRIEGGPWRNITIQSFQDFDRVKVSKLDDPDVGRWPKRGELFIETGSLDYSGLKRGDTIEIDTGGPKTQMLTVAGSVHDLNAALPIMNGKSVGFVSWDTLPDLDQPNSYNELEVVSSTRLRTLDEASAFGALIRDDVLVPAGVVPIRMLAHEPGVQTISTIFKAVSMLLVLVGVMTLLLSGFLVINTIGSLVAQQTRQLGVMKAIGARRGQLAGMYLVMVAAYGALALLVALPLGQLGTRRFVEFGGGILNFNVTDYSTPRSIVLIELAVGLLVPLLAAAVPVALGMRMPVRHALYGSGTSDRQFGEGIIDRMLGRVKGLSRPVALALRNTFVRKGRLALTLVALTLAAGVFMAVASVRTSIALTVQRVGDHRTMDIWADVYPSQSLAKVEQTAGDVPGVTQVEGWIVRPSVRVRPDRGESPLLYVEGLPTDTRYFHPEMEEGRWLKDGDENAIVIDEGFTDTDPDLQVGDDITLKIGDDDHVFHIVGFSRGDLLNKFAWVSRDYLDREIDAGGRVDTLMIGTQQHDADYQAQAAKKLTDEFADAGMRVTNTLTQRELQSTIHDSLNILVVFLSIMAALLVAVGGIGLSGTMSINVLESTREIGVMRAVGASNISIYQVFITEGVVVGLLSWVLGVVVSVPLSLMLTAALGTAMSFPLSFAYSGQGVLAWLVFVLVVSVLASLLPASRAARVSVAEAIAYE
ncbi:MAG TPA: ABC transporter permease [Coriobacteriia bacterium]|nr:ABC transporter permease [Coriobacteriia bacterium]